MDAIDREIKRDFKVTWPVFYALSGFAAAVMVISAIIVVKRHEGVPYSIFFLAVGLLTLVVTRLALISILKDHSDPQSSWRITDAGLQRIYRDFKPEIIRWDQVQLMKWIPFSGLLIVWSEPREQYRTRSDWFRNEQAGRVRHLYGHIRTIRTRLRVQKEEGGEVIRIAISKTGSTSDPLEAGPDAFKILEYRRTASPLKDAEP